MYSCANNFELRILTNTSREFHKRESSAEKFRKQKGESNGEETYVLLATAFASNLPLFWFCIFRKVL